MDITEASGKPFKEGLYPKVWDKTLFKRVCGKPLTRVQIPVDPFYFTGKIRSVDPKTGLCWFSTHCTVFFCCFFVLLSGIIKPQFSHFKNIFCFGISPSVDQGTSTTITMFLLLHFGQMNFMGDSSQSSYRFFNIVFLFKKSAMELYIGLHKKVVVMITNRVVESMVSPQNGCRTCVGFGKTRMSDDHCILL